MRAKPLPLPKEIGDLNRTLTSLLEPGNFRVAVPLVTTLLADEGAQLRRGLVRLSPSSPLRQQVTAAMAEVLGYLGEDSSAREWLAPWVKAGYPRFDASLPTRTRLQAAEYLTSLRHFGPASRLATEMLAAAQVNNDLWGQAEAAWLIARCAIREEDFEHAVLTAQQASFGFASDLTQPLAARQWRMGLSQLASGFASWRMGRPAQAQLLSARVHLAPSGDYIAQAQVEHRLGSVLRSLGGAENLNAALAAFGRAHDAYRRPPHHLHLARLSTHMGRSFYDLQQFAEAEKHFKDALTSAKDIDDPAVASRQQAETYVYFSWLEQTRPEPNYVTAEAYARRALDEAGPTGAMCLEAKLALGQCLISVGRDIDDATQLFQQVGAEAKTTKLKANATLRLAERYCASDGNLPRALGYLREAESALAAIEPGQYLQQRLADVRKKVQSGYSLLVFSIDDLRAPAVDPVAPGDGQGRPIWDLRNRLYKWAVGELQRDVERFPTVKKQAEALGLSIIGYKKLLRRLGTPQIRAARSPSAGHASHGRASPKRSTPRR